MWQLCFHCVGLVWVCLYGCLCVRTGVNRQFLMYISGSAYMCIPMYRLERNSACQSQEFHPLPVSQSFTGMGLTNYALLTANLSDRSSCLSLLTAWIRHATMFGLGTGTLSVEARGWHWESLNCTPASVWGRFSSNPELSALLREPCLTGAGITGSYCTHRALIKVLGI